LNGAGACAATVASIAASSAAVVKDVVRFINPPQRTY
jgi:hypothetical protein